MPSDHTLVRTAYHVYFVQNFLAQIGHKMRQSVYFDSISCHKQLWPYSQSWSILKGCIWILYTAQKSFDPTHSPAPSLKRCIWILYTAHNWFDPALSPEPTLTGSSLWNERLVVQTIVATDYIQHIYVESHPDLVLCLCITLRWIYSIMNITR